jgi:hypothetical protein
VTVLAKAWVPRRAVGGKSCFLSHGVSSSRRRHPEYAV